MTVAKFVPQPPETIRKPNNVVSVKMPTELIEPFYALCKTTGLSPSRLGYQCIKFALENMK
jgi:hypothetical protein